MKIEIEDQDLEELILTGTNNKYKQLARDDRFMVALGRAYRVLEVVEKASDLKMYSFLHYEQLKGIGKSSIRIMNGRIERLIFEENVNGLVIKILELNRDHYGDEK